MSQDSTLQFPTRNPIFCADDHLYEEQNPDASESLGGFRTSNPQSNRFQRKMIYVSEKKSRFKKTVELVLCVHGWKAPDRKDPMTLVVLGVSLSCHDRDSRFQSVRIKLHFDEDDKRHPTDAVKADPQVVAFAPFVQQEQWNTTAASVKDNSGYGGKLGVNQFGQAEANANKSSEISYTRKHFDRGSAYRLYDDRTGRIHGVEWFCQQNELQNYGVMPQFHLAILLERSHHEGKAIPFKAVFDMWAEAGFKHDFRQGLRRAFRVLRPEDDPVYFDPSMETPAVNGVAGVGERLLKSIQIDNLGALADGVMLRQLIKSAEGSLAGLEPMQAL
ncbi:hypothetical protein V8C35DRAFT_327589 [Trichoderma chlorosporum]